MSAQFSKALFFFYKMHKGFLKIMCNTGKVI